MVTACRARPRPRRAIRLLGPVVVEVDGLPLAVDTRKATALLAYLAVATRPVARDELAALLWPESDEAAARGALRRTLSVLNAAVGVGGLEISRSAVALGAGWHLDVRRFHAALSAARRHAHSPDQTCAICLAALEEAASLDRGRFMAGFSLRDAEPFDEWQLAEAEAYRRDLAGVLERFARASAARGDWATAIGAARRWLELDPLDEPAHRLLMLVLARSGEQTAAIRQYRECVRMLDAELGVAPLAETSELYESIRAGRVAPGSLTPALAPVVGPMAAVDRVPAPLVGRAAELAALARTWRSITSDGRLIVIEGEPGIGKTRLAAEFRHALTGAGATVLEARAYAGEATIAFAPVSALVRQGLDRADAGERLGALRHDQVAAAGLIVPALVASDESEALNRLPLDALGRARAIEAMADVLTGLVAGPAPGALILDDLDWADASTVEVVAFLGRRLAGRPLALVVTWRPLEPTDEDRRQLVAAAGRDGLVTQVLLERLTREQVAELARAELGERADPPFVDALFAESEGLPLYVAEVLAAREAGVGAVPRGVLELLRSRVASVGDLAGQVLAAAAVVGRSFDFETVRVASGRSEEETLVGLEELVRRGLVRELGTVDGDAAPRLHARSPAGRRVPVARARPPPTPPSSCRRGIPGRVVAGGRRAIALVSDRPPRDRGWPAARGGCGPSKGGRGSPRGLRQS